MQFLLSNHDTRDVDEFTASEETLNIFLIHKFWYIYFDFEFIPLA